MSETELAIKYLQPIADSATVGHYGDMLGIALAALREKQAREKGCDYCGLIYKLDGESYGTDSAIIENSFCPMCGKKLPVYAGTIGGEIVQHALKELGAEEGAEHERD